jgi:hypothetical protein
MKPEYMEGKKATGNFEEGRRTGERRGVFYRTAKNRIADFSP